MQDTKNNEISDAIVYFQNLDLDVIASVFRLMCVCYTSSKLTQGAIVQIDYRLPKYQKVKMPPELVLDNSSLEINDKIKNEDKASILNFVNTLYSRFSPEYLILLYNNLKSLQIQDKHDKKIIFKPNITGTYNVKKNIITIKSLTFFNTIYHELWHLSSSVMQNNIKFSGFSQNAFGRAINEGYTTLLTERYFPDPNREDSSYPIQRRVMQIIEMIVGQDKMEQLYLRANLKGLIENMTEYASEKEIMSFISDMDFVLDYLENTKFLPFKKGLLHKAFNNISEFLIKIITKYLVIQLKGEEKIYEEILNCDVMNILMPISIRIDINGESYVLLDVEKFYHTLQNEFNSNAIYKQQNKRS